MRILCERGILAPIAQALGPLRGFTQWVKGRHYAGNPGVASVGDEVGAGSPSHRVGLHACA